jgi:hypothetical protein
VSEQQAEQTLSELGSVGTGSTVPGSSDALIDSVMATVRETMEAPAVAADHEAPPKEDFKIEAPKLEPKMDVPKVEPKIEAPKVEAIKPEPPRETAKVRIMSPGMRSRREEASTQSATIEAAPRKSRFAAMAAVVALATVAGAIGGALATAGLTRVADAGAMTSSNGALETAIARIDADIVALKAGLEHTSRLGMSQFNKTSDRLDKIEKAQTEPTAKLARLSEALDKLRSTQPAAAASVTTTASPAPAPSAAPKDLTGTVTTPTGAAALPPPAAPPKTEMARLPTVEGWVLRDVGHGGALIEGRNGLYEVYAGDPVPGLGRVDAIRKQDGRWVVITTKGLVVSR